MNVRKLMRTPVMTVKPDTALKDVARLLCEFGISGVPVVNDDGAVVGVVSETDILFKELRIDGQRGRLRDVVFRSRRRTQKKAEAVTAGDAMTSPAVTISPEARVADAACLMIDRGVNRLPVVKDDRLVGLVARADLVRAFIRPDEELAAEVERILIDRFWLQPPAVTVDVWDGQVTVTGEVDSTQTALLVEQTLREVPGVLCVSSALVSRSKDGDFSEVPFIGK